MNSKGNFVKGSSIYVYKDSCKECGDPYLTLKSDQRDYCCQGHARLGERNPFFGKKMSEQLKSKLSEINKGRKKSKAFKEHLSKISKGCGNSNYKGGVKKLNIPLYNSYAHKVNIVEEVRRSEVNVDYLEVRCTYCGQWFVPKTSDITERIKVLKGQGCGESRLYCSEGCKKACSIYKRRKYPKGFKKATSREVQPELRQLVLKRDNYTCQYKGCDKTIENSELHCHHKEGININPIESADVDMCITFCKEHHRLVHKKEGCGYKDMICNK